MRLLATGGHTTRQFYHKSGALFKKSFINFVPPGTKKKRRRAILPRGVFSPPRRLTSEFGMGSGVSAGLSPPLCAPSARPLKTECHRPFLPEEWKRRRRFPSLRAPAFPEGKDGVLGLLVRPGSASRLACTGRPSNGSLARALTHSRDGRPSLGSGFALRCSQRLSGPRAASRRCPWRGNRTTVAASILVLAY